MSEHSKAPWKVTGKHFVDAPSGGGRLQEVAWCGDVEHGDREANARHIVKCVNSHERLVEALREVVSAGTAYKLEEYDQCVDDARKLLQELEGE